MRVKLDRGKELIITIEDIEERTRC